MDGVWFKYEKSIPDVLKGLFLKVRKGELLAIVGGNGVGKTTALTLMAGQNMPYRGKVRVNGSVAMLPQNPQTLFAKKTLLDDLYEMRQKNDDNFEHRLLDIMRLCRLEDLKRRHPYDLSGGEMQLAALAKVLLSEPNILLLEEPTKGMDTEFKQELAKILRSLTVKGMAIVMVSHNLKFCAEHASRCALIFDGSLASEGTPHELFRENSFYTTAANRMERQKLPEAVMEVDIILACGGAVPPQPTIQSTNEPSEKGAVKALEEEIKSPSKDVVKKNEGCLSAQSPPWL